MEVVRIESSFGVSQTRIKILNSSECYENEKGHFSDWTNEKFENNQPNGKFTSDENSAWLVEKYLFERLRAI